MGKIIVNYDGDMLFSTKVGNNEVKIDVPDAMGGKDRAMTPPQLMLVSLASCSAAFAARYCNNVGIDTEGLTVELEYDKLEAPTRLTNFKMNVIVPNAPEEKKKAILRAASHCPVKATLENFEGIEMELY